MATIGVKALRKVQIGLEGSSAGVQQAGTNVLIGEGTLKDTREIVQQMGDVGAFLGNQNMRTAKLGGELVFEQEATFEQIGYTLNASIDLATADQDGTGPFCYEWHLATTAPTSPVTYTFEAGDNISSDVEVMVYGYVPEFTLSGKGGEPLKLSTTWRGRNVQVSSDDGFTAGVAVPSVEAILFSKGTIEIDDAVGGTIGTTTADNTLMGFELRCNSGLKEVWTADGLDNPTFSFLKMTAPEVMVDFTFEHEANSVAQKVDWRADTAQLIRLKFPGSAATTAGTSHATKLLQIDLYGKWMSFDKLDEIDGNDIVVGTFKVLYDSTGSSLSMDILVVNELSALT